MQQIYSTCKAISPRLMICTLQYLLSETVCLQGLVLPFFCDYIIIIMIVIVIVVVEVSPS